MSKNRAKMKLKLIGITGGLLIGVLILGYSLAGTGTAQAQRINKVFSTGEPAAPVLLAKEQVPVAGGYALPFTMTTYNSDKCGMKRISLGNYVGKARKDETVKVVVLNFFAAHCKACMKELDGLQPVYKENKDKGFLWVSVSIDKDQEDITEVMNIISAKNLMQPVIKDNLSILAKRYGVESTPTTFIIDPAGKILSRYTSFDEKVHEEMVGLIKSALNGSS